MIIDVRAFGARGDGVSDDTKAIRKAIAATGFDPTTRTGARDTVYFPAGTYHITDSIVSFGDASADWRMDLRLVGEGMRHTFIKNSSSTKPTLKMQSTLSNSSQVRGLYVADIGFSGVTNSTTNEYPIDAVQVTEIQLHRVLFYQSRKGAMRLNRSIDCTFYEVVCDFCGDGGFSYAIIHLLDSRNMWISDCILNNCLGSSGLLVEGGLNITVQNSDIAGFGDTQIKLGLGRTEDNPFPTPSSLQALFGFTLRNCLLELADTHKTQILVGANDTNQQAAAIGVRIENVFFEGNNHQYLDGIVFQNCVEAKVSDCVFAEMTASDVVIFKIQETPPGRKTGISIGRQRWIGGPGLAKYLVNTYKGSPFGAPTFIDENTVLELGQIQIGGGNSIKKHFHASALLDFPSLPPHSTTELSVIIPRVSAVGGLACASPQQTIEPGLVWSAYVLGSDTVIVRVGNVTNSPIDPSPRTWEVNVWEY